MREIKFRAWDTNEKRLFPWHTTRLHLGNWADKPTSFPEIVLMQFTNLHDKNGKEIWEGDLLQEEDGNVAEVVWVSDDQSVYHCGFAAKLPKTQIFPATVMALTHKWEVIGNAWEHPHLLTKTDV